MLLNFYLFFSCLICLFIMGGGLSQKSTRGEEKLFFLLYNKQLTWEPESDKVERIGHCSQTPLD